MNRGIANIPGAFGLTASPCLQPADIDNRELERVKRVQKQEAEWEARARALEQEEETKLRLKREAHKREVEKGVQIDRFMEQKEVFRKAKVLKAQQEVI